MKKKYLCLLLVVALVFLGGITYAFFSYSKIGENSNIILLGDIFLNFEELEDEISITKVFPETYDEAHDDTLHTGVNRNSVNFKISGINTSNRDVHYSIKLVYGDEISGKERVRDWDLAFSLTETIDDVSNEIIHKQSYSNINELTIYSGTIPGANSIDGESFETNYDLRMWVKENVRISDTDETSDYSTSDYKNLFATVKIKVEADMSENQDKTTKGDVSFLKNMESGNVISLENFTYLKKNKEFRFTADVDNFTNGVLTIYHWENNGTVDSDNDGIYDSGKYQPSYISIDRTNINYMVYRTDTVQSLSGSTPHGITDFSGKLDIIITNNTIGYADVKVSTGNEEFSTTQPVLFYGRGYIKAKLSGENARLNNAIFEFKTIDYDRDFLVLGDSYMDHWPRYVLNEKDIMAVSGYSGGTSTALINEFEKSLQFGKPKNAVWCLGMNDGNLNVWKQCLAKFLELCRQNNITPIIATTPNTVTINNVEKNNLLYHITSDPTIDLEGVEIIDFAGALNATEAGSEWLVNGERLLSDDNVHPNQKGARFIAEVFKSFLRNKGYDI